MITLYDLAFAEDRRPSPYCWRTKLALKHKGLDWRDEPTGFSEKQKLAFANSTLVPVIHDGIKVIKDSWAIAEHLEANYAGRPLFPNDPTHAYARFVNGWADTAINTAIFPNIAGDLVDRVRPELEPARRVMSGQKFLSGDAPAYPDYILFGSLMWPRTISTLELLDKDDAVYAWRESMLDLFDGMGRKAIGP